MDHEAFLQRIMSLRRVAAARQVIATATAIIRWLAK